MKKRVFSAFLTLVMLFTLIPATALTAFAAADVPSGYTKVEYIESEGSSHIDTEWVSSGATSSYAYEIEYAANEQMLSSNTVLFGANGSSTRAACINFRSAGHTSVAFGSTSGASSPAKWTTTTDKVKVKVEVDLTAKTWDITKDGAAMESPTGSINGTPVNENSLYVFRNNNGSGGDYDSLAKVYGLKIWQDGTLVRDFVPCIETATATAGLYDLVNEKFHGAAGDGLIYGPDGAAKCTVTFTTPSDVVLTVSEGFTVGLTEQVNDGKTMVVVDPISQSTEGDVTSRVYKLAEGRYRFLAMGKDSVPGRVKDGAKTVKYYNWDKNFIVTAEDVARGSKTIDANPGLLGGKGFEQSNSEYDYFVRQYTDEMLASEALTVSDELKAMYPEVFTTPTFTNTEGRARHQFSTQEEMEAFVAELDGKTDYMTTYWIGRSKGDRHDLSASFFTTENLTGKSLAEAAEAIKANGKPTIYLHAQMHGSEQSATEGALATMAYLCGDYGKEVIKTVNIVSVPRVNPDGSEINKYASESGTGWRNINRDAMSLTQPETKAIIELYELIQPEVCLDHHEWRATISTNTSSLDDVRLYEIISTNAPKLLSDVQYELVDMLFDMYDAHGLRRYYYRFNPIAGPVTVRDYYSLRGSIAMLCETPGQRRGNQQWERRVLTQFLTAKAMIDWTVANADEVNEIVAAAKAELASNGKTYDEDNRFTLKHSDGTPITAKRWIYDLRDGTPIEERSYTLYRDDGIEVSRAYPIYYIVPKDASGIADVLTIANMHGIEYSEVDAGEVMELRGYTGDYTGASLTEPELMSFRSGAYKFPVAQERNAVVCTLMEPDILDSQQDTSPYLASFVMQGHLDIDEVFRCENDSEHALTFVPAKAANCGTAGCYAHYICLCGKAFASDEHKNALAEEDYIIPASGSHSFVEQADGSFACEYDCGTTATDLAAAVAACDGIGGAVKAAKAWALAEALIIPADVTLDMGGWMLEVPAGLVVNEGGAVTNGNLCVSKTSGAVVNLGSNGGWVPVCYTENDGEALYALYPAAAKTGKDVTYLDNGTKYSFGYKFDDAEAYAAAVAAGAESIRFGVNIALQSEDADADYSFSKASVDKMLEVGAGADDFFKVNLSLTGEKVDDVVATPYIKVPALGFRFEGAKSSDFIPVTEVATFDGVKYTSLESAIVAAEAAGGTQEIVLIADITYKRPTVLKMNGNVGFVVKESNDITISGPVTFDGQGLDGGKLLFRVQGEAKLTLDGVTVQNYKFANASSGFGSVGRIEEAATLVMTDCTVKNCSSARRGALYITGTSTVSIDGCTFENNTAQAQYGGALAIYSTSGVSVKNSVFTGNRSLDSDPEYGLGGAIRMRSGALTLDGCSFSGNSALLGDDVSVTNGTLTLKGTTAMSEIHLVSGRSVTLGESFALAANAAPIAIDGAEGTIVLTGALVGENYDKFVSADADMTITEGGLLKSTKTEYVAMIGTAGYSSLASAFAEANVLAADAPVTVVLVDDASLEAAVTLGGANKVTVTLAEDAAEGRTITVKSGANITVGGDVEFVGGGTGASDPKLVLDGGSTTSASGEMLLVENQALTLKNGVVLQNFITAQDTGAPVRAGASSTLTFDGVTAQNNEGKAGAVYVHGHAVVKLSNSKFLNNTGHGCVYVGYATADTTFDNCTFTGNTGTNYGSALSLNSSSSTANKLTGAKATCTVKNCVFEQNSCTGAAQGTVHVRGSSTLVTMADCTFTGNTGADDAIYIRAGSVAATNVTVDGIPYAG